MLHRLGILLLCLSSTLLASDRLPNIVYLMSDELAYYGKEKKFTISKGEYQIFIGTDSNAELSCTFKVK